MAVVKLSHLKKERAYRSYPMEELKRFPKFVKIGDNYKEWGKIIQSILSKKWPKKYKTEEKRLAEENSWEEKVGKILSISDE